MPARKAPHDDENDDLKLLYIMAYFLLWVSGILIYLIYGNRNKRLRFHSFQAVLYGIVWTVLQVIFGIAGFVLGPLSILLSIVLLILWLYGLYVGYKAMDGIDIKITAVGDIAERYS